jgi:hypothetical protein
VLGIELLVPNLSLDLRHAGTLAAWKGVSARQSSVRA